MSDVTSVRDRILDAAISLLEAEGEAALRTERVAEVAHVPKQSLYNLFGDREGLIVAAHAEQYRRILTGLDFMTDAMIDCLTLDDFAKVILTVASNGVRGGAERRRLRIQALGSATTRPELAAAIREVHRTSTQAVTKVVAFGQRRGWVNTTYTASTITEMWWSLITGYHLAEAYALEADALPAGNAAVDALSLLMFGKVFPEFSSERPTRHPSTGKKPTTKRVSTSSRR